jgi:mono/diheme cytochrome c family protein
LACIGLPARTKTVSLGSVIRVLVVVAAAAAFAPLAFAGSDRVPAKFRPNTAVGEALFVGNCSGCHTFKPANATGFGGPNLDAYPPPSLAYVKYQVTHGGGIMPAFTRFTAHQVADIAAFVWTKK